MKRFIFLIFIIFSKGLFSIENSKGISGSIKVAEENYLFKGKDNILKLYDKDDNFSLIVTIDKNNKDESSIVLINNLKKSYVLLTKTEINSIAALKNLFSFKNSKEKHYEIKEIENSQKKIIGFNFKGYSSFNQDSKMNLFFSKDMDNYLKKFIDYNDFIKFVNDIDLSAVPFLDMYFELIKYFINKSSELGFIGQIYLNDNSIYSISSLEELAIRDEEIKIPKNYQKKGIESLIENL